MSDREPPLPDFVVIGAQKGGTHWIRDNLRAHPDVYMPTEELHFFTQPVWVERRGGEGYRQMFSGWDGQRVVGEATPGYTVWKHDPARMARAIHELLPDVRLIAILRDPVERALSALAHFQRIGVADPADGDLLEVIARQPPEDDPLGLVAVGWYAANLRPYVQTFGDQLLVVFNEELEAEPAAVYDRLLAHIGLEPGYRPPDLADHRFSFVAERFGVRALTADQRAKAFEYFASDVAELEQLMGRDLSAWRPGSTAAAASPRAGSTGSTDAVDRLTPAEARLLDLGCGTGESLVVAERRFGTRGVGIELKPSAVETAQARGLSVYQGDVLALVPADYPQVEFVNFDNVLEHLASLEEIEQALTIAAKIASRQIFIRHPSFEDVEYLRDLGLKLYWTDWKGHRAQARIHELVAIAGRLGLYDVSVQPVTRIWSSTNPCVLPLGAPPNQFRPDPQVASVYREELHGPKPEVAFDRPVYTAFGILLTLPGAAPMPPDPAGPAEHRGPPRDIPGHAPRSWTQLLVTTVGSEPRVVERPNGTTVVLEAGLVRKVPSPIVARALRHRFGLSDVEPGELRTMLPGPPVVGLKTPGESVFVVVGGRRMTVPSLGTMVHTEDPWYAGLVVEPPLDVLRAAAELQRERRRQ